MFAVKNVVHVMIKRKIVNCFSLSREKRLSRCEIVLCGEAIILIRCHWFDNPKALFTCPVTSKLITLKCDCFQYVLFVADFFHSLFFPTPLSISTHKRSVCTFRIQKMMTCFTQHKRFFYANNRYAFFFLLSSSNI